MTTHSIYTLSDASGIRYIGVTSVALEQRLKDHLRERSSKNYHKWNWINKYRTDIKIQLLFGNLTEQNAYQQEIKLIAEYKANGCKLVNQSTGGEHAALGTKRSEETRKKLRELRLGKTMSEETKRKISESCKGKTGNQGNLGKKRSAETKAKIAKALTGNTHGFKLGNKAAAKLVALTANCVVLNEVE
jgi:predicted GIY-YIG superfamily endonuclease